jgi:hypothetical protein
MPPKGRPLEPGRLRVEQEQEELQSVVEPHVLEVSCRRERDRRVAGIERGAEASIGEP